MSDKIHAAYYGNWDCYSRKFFLNDIPIKNLNVINYAFLSTNADGSIKYFDKPIDTEVGFNYSDHSIDWNKTGWGNLSEFKKLKQQKSDLKVLVSFWGWTLSQDCWSMISNKTAHQKFANECLALLQKYSLDGIDLDPEYIATDKGLTKSATMNQDAENFADLVKTLRTTLGTKYLITMAAPAGPDNINALKPQNLKQYLDWFNLMAYDYCGGSWSKVTYHLANLYNTSSDPTDNFSTDIAIKEYVKLGIPMKQMVLGYPTYGRSFGNTLGFGKSCTADSEGTWEPSCFDYKKIDPAYEKVDRDRVAAYYYNPTAKRFISYDNPETLLTKVNYAKDKGLRGLFFWESSSDEQTGNNRCLTDVVAKNLFTTDPVVEPVVEDPKKRKLNISMDIDYNARKILRYNITYLK